MVADILATPVSIAEREAEIIALSLALEFERQRSKRLEAERSDWLAEKAELVDQLERAITEREQLRRQVEELGRRRKLDSTNSSKPPSSDGLRRKPKPSSPERKRRKEQSRRPGKQARVPATAGARRPMPWRGERRSRPDDTIGWRS